MVTLKPFRVVRPAPEKAAELCTLPYDVMNTEEARAMAEGKPSSFLRVTRSEIEFPADANPYSDEVYRHGAAKLRQLLEQGDLVQEPAPVYMLYRITMGSHTQVGLVAVASCAEYDAGVIKKHELTRPDKEDDRARHINILGAQTGPVFMTYRVSPSIDELVKQATTAAPDIDFTADDGIRHSAWIVRDSGLVARLETAFSQLPALYVADGHHRSAAASRVARERSTSAGAGLDTGTEPYRYFLTVSFPSDQVQILGYNRVVADLNGLTAEQLLDRIAEVAEIESLPSGRNPERKGEATFYLGGQWRLLRWKPEVATNPDPVESLDVAILQSRVLTPLLAVGDPRTDKRISFVGGIRGTAELEKLVDTGRAAIAFAMFPTSVDELMTIADHDGLMPPKSTWFEPKLRDGVAVHLIDGDTL